MIFCLALFLMWTACWVPFFLLPIFSQLKAGTSSNLAFYVLVICSASTIPGCDLAVPFSNKFGSALSMGAFASGPSILLLARVAVASIASVIVCAVLIALVMGPLAVIHSITVHRLTPNEDLVGARMGGYQQQLRRWEPSSAFQSRRP